MCEYEQVAGTVLPLILEMLTKLKTRPMIEDYNLD
jgi:hypothetical protein